MHYRDPAWIRIAQSVYRPVTDRTVRGSDPGDGEVFHTRPDRARPASCTMGTGSLPKENWSRRVVDHPPPSRVEVKEIVGLYRYSPSGHS